MRKAVFLLALASANGGISMRVIEPMLPRLATDFGTSISDAASVITAYSRGAAVSMYSGSWSFGQAMGVAAMGLVVGFIECTPAIVAFGCGFFLLGLWMRSNLHRLS